MCGRYTLSKRDSLLQRFRLVERDYPNKASYNIAPTQQVPVIVSDQEGRQLVEMKWGLVPSWVKDIVKHKPLINARAETVAEKPSFRNSFKKRRCLIPTDGYYEWKIEQGIKKPIYIHHSEKALFAFAGLWDQTVTADGEVLQTCTIITLPAQGKLAALHDSMPAILRTDAEDIWLDNKIQDHSVLFAALASDVHEKLAFYEVDKLVNSARVDSPDCITSIKKDNE